MSIFSKPAVINVTSDGDSLLWSIPVQDIDSKEVNLCVGEGCQAIIYLDGAPKPFEPGKKTLQWRKIVAGHSVSVVGVNLEKRFPLKFGAGDIPCNDWEIGETPLVGLSGECDVNVMDASSIHKIFGSNIKNIKISDIKEKIDAKVKEFIGTELSNALKTYGYVEINGRRNELSDKLKEKFNNEFISDGISISRCSIRGICFPDGYGEHRQEVIRAKAEGRKNEARQNKELDIISRFAEAKANSSAKPVDKAKNKPIFCPRCGKENSANTKFCKYCGVKLD